MLRFEQARARVLADLAVLATERVAFDAAVGRVLADDVCACRAQPAFDYSAMDGYAVRASDLDDHARILTVVGESRTGGAPPPALASGTTCRIFTGALLPDGADAVVMQEEVVRDGERAHFERSPKPGANIRRRGEDVAEGQSVLTRGTRLTAFHVAMLASVEALKVSVARRPVVTVLSTGDELREAGTADRLGAVVDANGPALAALATHCGAHVRLMPFARDDREVTRVSIAEALEGSDLVLTVGGVSVGEYDHVREAMTAAGVSLDFWKVAIKPGKPLCVGRRAQTRVLGLPGNPSSALLNFVLFAAPLLRAMQGDARPAPPLLVATLGARVAHQPGRTEFIRATLDVGEEGMVVHPLRNQASGSVTSFAWADVLAVIPAEAGDLAAGDRVQYMRLADV